MKVKYSEDLVFRVYDLAKQGLTRKAIAQQIGVDPDTFNAWRSKYPLLQKALDTGKSEGRESLQKVDSFQDYVYRQLSPELQGYWDKLRSYEKEGAGIDKINALLERGGLNTRKALFVHALICCNFNASRACRKIGIAVSTLNDWISNDPQFRDLVTTQMEWHKGNFFEEALVNLVRRGDASAIIFANKTFNKGRGYDTKVAIETSGEVQHKHTVSISDLNKLPLETRLQILEAIKAEETPQLGEYIEDAVIERIVED